MRVLVTDQNIFSFDMDIHSSKIEQKIIIFPLFKRRRLETPAHKESQTESILCKSSLYLEKK